MPTRNEQGCWGEAPVTRETRLSKVSKEAVRRNVSRFLVAENSTLGVPTQPLPSTTATAEGENKPERVLPNRTFVPVVDSEGKPLMPTSPSRAKRWVKTREATSFWNHGLWCIRLNREPSARNMQNVAVGVDPGSKKEGYTVASKAHVYQNIQADAVTWVKDAVETRKQMRRNRRSRKTPCRQNRKNRAKSPFPPSTKARWDWKLRMCKWLMRSFPVSQFVVEDVAAKTMKHGKRWNASFSPLEVGKAWFYAEISKLAPLSTMSGWDTKQLRDALNLKKIGNKKAEVFESHCVDSFVLASRAVGGTVPDNKNLMLVTPLQFHRRQLHALRPSTGSIRRPYGGTRSLGFKRGSLVKHPKYGLSYVGGTMSERISLHRIDSGERMCRNAKPSDCRFLAYNSWRTRLLPTLKGGVPAAR